MSSKYKIPYKMIDKQKLDNLILPKSYLIIRRIIEIFIIIIIAPVIIPLCLIIALLIKVLHSGPVIFIQKRPGINNSVIDVYKFRTMFENKNKKPDEIRHIDSDVTALGRFLRKHRLDELPQFWNVLKGDMSLIGPRPEPLYYYNKCTEQVPLYSCRFKIKPGITGWAQIWYKHTDDIETAINKLEYDVYYLMNISPKTDFQIFFHTFRVILFGTGAK